MSNRWDGFDEVVAVADTGTFVGAAKRLGTSTSHVSRAVARLEQSLGAQFFHRTTRAVSLTDTGRTLVDQFRRLIAERDEAIAMLDLQGEPQGQLRITCPTSLGERFIARIVHSYVQEYPRLSVEMDLTNRVVELVSEGFDLALRTGTLPDSRLIATQIAMRGIMTCAAPDYIVRQGEPLVVDDLEQHECLLANADVWRFRVNGEPRSLRPRGRWRCNSGAAVLEATLSGMGLCQLPTFYVSRALAEGRLVEVLTEFRPADDPIWAVYPQRRHLLPKVQRLIDKLRRELPAAMSEG
ncbi:DNA-binding transcriptional LysR family regulator [Novosphingobium hassiacum]|uniref:DNA-binding transcriptional LysR family regulator n=1 Tax=Novosphingobium hassiacum TaxID=173676 RepID=A0A7W6EUK6_9SPHN|nr:LysR family transcriptional regulator [Novosphingobium hassiacum]MBB3859231.1 DNA-binding transcriptional LysR family regulator [Novosphingobium hassiacum]